MEKVKTSEVFVPGTQPKYTYNPRTGLEDNLERYLRRGGKILTVAGPTKTGKSVLLRKKIANPIWIQVAGVETADDFWKKVGDQLHTVATVEVEEHSESGKSGDARGSVGFLKVVNIEAGAGATTSSGQSRREIINRSFDFEAKRALVASGRILVVDDFHFIPAEARRDIVRHLKPMVENREVLVIFASITHRGTDVVSAVPDMQGRVELLKIDFWSQAELIQIARDGFAVLNVEDPDDALSAKLASTSFGSPHIMQQLCLELCEDVNYIFENCETLTRLNPPEDWDIFFTSYVSPVSAEQFRILKRGPQERGRERIQWTLEDGRKFDIYGLALAAIAHTGPQLTLTKDGIKASVRDLMGSDGPEPQQTTRVLNHMSKMASRKSGSDKTERELDEDSGDETYSDVQPVLEYVEDEANSLLHIIDPFFAYYLKWGSFD